MKLRLQFAGYSTFTDTWRFYAFKRDGILASHIFGTPSIRVGL